MVEQVPGLASGLEAQPLELKSERLGPLPLLNHLLEQLSLDAILDRFVPTLDSRSKLAHGKALGVLLRSLLVEREPIYRQQETVTTFAPEAFGLTPEEAGLIDDDRIGRALDRLFDADRGALLTEIVVTATQRFELKAEEFHNDSTSVRFCGQYAGATGRSIRGRRAPFITYGYSKDHRPDLKQLLFILTSNADGGVPVQFRCDDGNRSDSKTHETSWDALRQITGKSDFLYVADSKLCGGEAMDYIDRRGGRFVTVLPRSRGEDKEFRHWIQTHEPAWETVRNRRHPRRRHGARDVWKVFRYPIPSAEGWPLFWVSSTLLALNQHRVRRERLTRAAQLLEKLLRSLTGKRPRKRSKKEIEKALHRILEKTKAQRYLKIKVVRLENHTFHQERPGRPGPDTRYRRKTTRRWTIEWEIDEAKLAYDAKSDGMYPLLTNDRCLTGAQVLEAHKRQPAIEKRFEQTKTVFEIAPVLLKNEARIEALFTLYFLALLVQGLVERELRRAMARLEIQFLPLYPEERPDPHPTAEQVFRLFSHVSRNILVNAGAVVRVFEHQLTDRQMQVLMLLGVPAAAFRR